MSKVKIPQRGQKIILGQNIPDNPIIPYVEGDGIGVDITPVMIKVVDSAVEKSYGGKKKIHWMEVYAGGKATQVYGEGVWLPEEPVEYLKEYVVSIKGPMTTPIGGGIRSLNVALRQQLDLYQCIRPIHYFQGVPSPMKDPSKAEMVIFRENTEDIYAGIEWPAGSDEAKKIIQFLQNDLHVKYFRSVNETGIGIKPISKEGSERLFRAALNYAIRYDRKSVTIVHKGNIMKYTEGAFRDWSYALAQREFNAEWIGSGPWVKIKNPHTGNEIVIKDAIADNFLQQVLLRPEEYDVIATMNLNGDYLSDALAAQVGGIGMAPGANVSDNYAMFEATHGTAPKYAGLNKANPSSLILSAVMMLQYLGWKEAAEKIIDGIQKSILEKKVTYDLARDVPEATELSTSEFGSQIIKNMQ